MSEGGREEGREEEGKGDGRAEGRCVRSFQAFYIHVGYSSTT